jgi:DNA repair protein RecO (recombination protein O)
VVANRIQDEPGFVVHRYDWSESSLILEIWSRHQGRVALVAKGAKKPNSQWRPVLLPLQPLRLDWWGDGEIRNLKAARWAGGAVMPAGDGLLAGMYLNELLLRTMAREDPYPELFDVYTLAVQGLQHEASRLSCLRAWELHLLKSMGVLPNLSVHGTTHKLLDSDRAYQLQPNAGLQLTAADGIPGRSWRMIEDALQNAVNWERLVQCCQTEEFRLRGQLRTLLHYHSGLTAFRTRKLWLDVAEVGQRAQAKVTH